MAYVHTPGWCKACDRKVLAIENRPNHVLHLLLALVTVGLWIPVWILLSMFQGSMRCPTCGAKCSRGKLHSLVQLCMLLLLAGLAAILYGLYRQSGSP